MLNKNVRYSAVNSVMKASRIHKTRGKEGRGGKQRRGEEILQEREI
jgi:hypothetical protein